MKKLSSTFVLVVAVYGMASAVAADFTMQAGQSNTISVEGCARGEVGVAYIAPSIDGEHKLTTRCLPVFCAYTNETPLTWFGTSWSIKLLARDTDRDSQGVFKGDPQFDRRFDKVLHKSVETKTERDAVIARYLRDGTCKGVYYDRDVPAL